MANKTYEIKTMTRKELDIAVDWARQEGWNPGLYDADAFYAQDPNGFFIGYLGDEPIATISAVKYGNSGYAFGGFYIVKKEYRGSGYGMAIFQKAMDYVKDCNLGGDGVVENLEKYATVGLKLAHMNARYGGKGSGTGKVQPNVVELSTLPFETVAAYDDLCFGVPRREFLKQWITQPESKAFGYAQDGKLMGYGMIRKCFAGYKIGPLFADNKTIAQALFDTLVGQVDKNSEIFFDTPECNQDAVKMATDYGMKKVFATGRVYTKGQPKFPLEKWYGVTTFELG
jgi:GNAT superfamily N-acetyltransferase